MHILRRLYCKLVQSFFTHVLSLLKSKGRVLMLHWIGDDTDESHNKYSISVDEFNRLALWLKIENTIRLEDWEKAENFCALTIDDVPENFYLNAYPILLEKHIPFTIFVNTSLLDTDGYITTSQLKEMAGCGLCTIGSHGVEHDLFYCKGKEDIIKDLTTSKAILEHIVGKEITMYAYPYGSYYACGFKNKHLVTDVYKYGFGTIGCGITNPLIMPYYFLPRINVTHSLIKNLYEKTC